VRVGFTTLPAGVHQLRWRPDDVVRYALRSPRSQHDGRGMNISKAAEGDRRSKGGVHNGLAFLWNAPSRPPTCSWLPPRGSGWTSRPGWWSATAFGACWRRGGRGDVEQRPALVPEPGQHFLGVGRGRVDAGQFQAPAGKILVSGCPPGSVRSPSPCSLIGQRLASAGYIGGGSVGKRATELRYPFVPVSGVLHPAAVDAVMIVVEWRRQLYHARLADCPRQPNLDRKFAHPPPRYDLGAC
jgi:hypothetical protein